MALLFICPDRALTAWVGAIRRLAPEIDVRIYPQEGRPEEVEMAVAWKHPPGALRRYPNLRTVLSLGAGVDHLVNDPEAPEGVAYGRIVDPGLVQGMSTYAVGALLDAFRTFDVYRRHQSGHLWQPELPRREGDWPIGILGLGAMGGDLAEKLTVLGFPVLGWGRSSREAAYETFAGPDGLDAMLPQCRALVCLLPLTDDTRHILDARLFGRLPRGAFLLNVARGGHLVEADLLQALDDGQIERAWLAVFAQEPLPPSHPFWSHPRVVVTPHIASITNPETAAEQVVDDYRRTRAGEPLTHPVVRARGY